MPGPPPPPPPGAPPPMMPAAVFSPPSSRGPDNRGALLKSIQKGTKLKKTVTNDKSAPVLGKVATSNSSGGGSPNPSYRANNNNNNTMSPAMNGLGGLFAGGMPKLKPTGKNIGVTVNSANAKTPESPSPKSFNSIQSELKKQMANDGRNLNRGPPPPAPARTYNNTEDSSSRQFVVKNGNSNGFHQNPSLPNLASPNQGAYHRKTASNISISSVDSGLPSNGQPHSPSPRPVINHGKPNLAPKPPILNGKPAAPPKKLVIKGKPVSRAQSMRSPRSPSPQSPDNNNSEVGAKFGTVRNLSQVLNQNLGQSLGNLSHVKPRPPLNGRPTAPPPSIPNTPPPPPPSKTVKPPNHAPPPPPTNVIPQAPNHAPPPPPHRTGPQVPARAPPLVPPVINAPPPPPRHSSIRDVSANSRRASTASSTSTMQNTLESRYTFHSVSEFPRPMPFRGVHKVYTSRQESKC